MALSAAIIWEVRTGGSDNSGGGFVAGASGTDRSQQDAAFASGTNLTVDAVTNTDVAPDGHTPAAADVGNIIQITAGGGFTTGFYEIVSIQSGKWRLDRSPAATGTAGGTWAMGGALATPGKSGGAMVAGNDVYQKAGTYTVTSATPNIAGGCVTMPAGASAANTSKWIGYQTTRGDNGTRPVIIADGVITTFTLVTLGTNCRFENVEVNGNSRTSSRGINATGANGVVYKCVAKNCTLNGITGAASSNAMLCEATGCSTQSAFSGVACYGCLAYSNTVTGFQAQNCIACLAVNNSGASSDGFNNSFVAGIWAHCTAYNNGRHGFFSNASTTRTDHVNCLAVGNGGYGYTASAAYDMAYLYNCAGYNNTSGNVNSSFIPSAQQIGFVALSGDPFTNAAGGDFSLNRTANAGDLARQGGVPGTFAGVSTTGYPDIGAVQEGGVRVADIAAIADQVWDEARAGHVAAGSFGEGVVVNSIANNAITASAINADAITAAKIANDAIGSTEISLAAQNAIADRVWSQLTTASWPLDSFGTAISATMTTLSNNVSTLLSRLGAFTGSGVNTVLGFLRALMRKDGGITTPSDVGGTYDHAADSNEAIRDRGDAAWTTATGFSTLTQADVRSAVGLSSANLDTQLDNLDVKIDTVEAQTDDIGAAGAGLTNIPWNPAWDAEVQSEVQDAIEANHLDHLLAADYDPANKPGVATALFNELVESDGGVSRYTANALEEAPSGGGGSSAPSLS